MATLTFYNNSITGIEKFPEATPGDLSNMIIRRGFCDTTKQTLNNADVGNVIKINAGELVVGLWYRVITAEDTSNAKIHVGLGGGVELVNNGAVTPANTVVMNTAIGIHAAAANNVTIKPLNGVAIDAGVFEVGAIIVKSFSKFGG